ncbi:hypothetical protein D3C73_952410 [compost metagenome]
MKNEVVSRLRGWRCRTEKWHIGAPARMYLLLSGNSHGYQQRPDRLSAGVRYTPKQPPGDAHHRCGGAGAFDQRPDPVGAAVDLPDAQGQLWPDLHPGRPDHPDVPVDGLAVAAVGRLLHRSPPQAVAAAGGYGVHSGRHSDDVGGRQLPVDFAGGGLDRHRFFDLPPRSVPRGAPGFGRALRAGAIDLPGRR